MACHIKATHMKMGKELHSLHGPVRSVRVEQARFKEQDGQLTEEREFSHSITFSRDGSVVEQTYRNPDGSEWRAVNDYSASGKLLAMRSHEPSGTLISDVRYIYDEKGTLIAEFHKTQDGKVTTSATYAYDMEDREIKIQEFAISEEENVMIGIEGTNTGVRASEANRIETRYDERGDAIEVKVFNATGALTIRVEITRDEHGNPLEETQYVGDTPPFGHCSTEACRTEETVEL